MAQYLRFSFSSCLKDGNNYIYKLVRKYATQSGLVSEISNIGAHAMRATAATNALEHAADIAKVQEMLGHSNISTTKLYDRRSSNPMTVLFSKLSFNAV